MSFSRPTSMADAFITAALKVDHKRNPQQWVARRTLLNCQRTGFAVVKEFDHSPKKPAKRLDEKTIKAINLGIDEIVQMIHAARVARLDAEKVLEGLVS